MVVTQPDYYKEFSCIAGDCPDSCCIGWQVIPDAEHLEYYSKLEGELGDEIRKAIVNVNGEPTFSLCNGRCSMLRDDGLCKIQFALGEEALSSVCGFYPRFVTELGLIREQGLSISCPEVARMILTREDPIVYESFRTDDPLKYYHDIEPERLLAIRSGRDNAIKLMQDSATPFAKRLERVLTVGLQVDEIEFPEKVIPMEDDVYFAFRRELYALFMSLEHLRPEWTEILKAGQEGRALASLDDARCWENLLSYYLFKYSLRAAMEETFLENLSLAVVSIFLLQELFHQGAGELIYLVQLYAKETEHSEDNLDELLRVVGESPLFSPESLLSLLKRFYESRHI